MQTFEITFVPAGRRKGPGMSYILTKPSLVEATREARRQVDIEAPGYKLHSHRVVSLEDYFATPA